MITCIICVTLGIRYMNVYDISTAWPTVSHLTPSTGMKWIMHQYLFVRSVQLLSATREFWSSFPCRTKQPGASRVVAGDSIQEIGILNTLCFNVICKGQVWFTQCKPLLLSTSQVKGLFPSSRHQNNKKHVYIYK